MIGYVDRVNLAFQPYWWEAAFRGVLNAGAAAMKAVDLAHAHGLFADGAPMLAPGIDGLAETFTGLPAARRTGSEPL